MARKKKHNTKRRKRAHHLSAAPRCRRSVKTAGRKRRSTRRRTGLSAAFTHAGLVAAAKQILGGSAGGFAAGIGHKAMASMSPLARAGVQLAVSFGVTSLVGWPNIGAGYAGGAAALESQAMTEKLLSEVGIGAGKYADSRAANQLPMMLNDNGNVLTLMEDENGTFVYMDENNGNAYLAESVYPDYMPRY